MTLKYFLNFINAIQLFRDEENKKCLQGKKSKALFVSKGKFKIYKKMKKLIISRQNILPCGKIFDMMDRVKVLNEKEFTDARIKPNRI